MSKLMTINMLFEALKDGRVTMDTTFAVSDRAVEMTRAGGSTMMLQHDDRPTVDELIHGMIVNSGNDACVVVAEGLAAGVVGDLTGFTGGVTNRTNPIPVSTPRSGSGGFRGGGGGHSCACACACAGCACACAGGGR